MGKLKVLFLLLMSRYWCYRLAGQRRMPKPNNGDGEDGYELVKKGSLTFAASGVYKPFNFEENGN